MGDHRHGDGCLDFVGGGGGYAPQAGAREPLIHDTGWAPTSPAPQEPRQQILYDYDDAGAAIRAAVRDQQRQLTPSVPALQVAYVDDSSSARAARAASHRDADELTRVATVDLPLDAMFGKADPYGRSSGAQAHRNPATRIAFQVGLREHTAALRRNVHNHDGSQTWIGEHEDGYGDVVFTRVGDAVYGMFPTDEGMMLIEPRSGRGQYAIVADPSASSDVEECGADDEPALLPTPSSAPAPAPAAAMSMPPAAAQAPPGHGGLEFVDLLVVYTKEARATKGDTHEGMLAYIWTLVHVTNQIWERSLITTHRVRVLDAIEVVSTGPEVIVTSTSDFVGLLDRQDQAAADMDNFPGFNPAQNVIAQTSHRLWSPSSGAVATDPSIDPGYVPDYRDHIGADIVAVMLSQGYNGWMGGASAALPSSAKAESVDVTSTISAAPVPTTRWAFPHEIGHTLGLLHNGGSSPKGRRGMRWDSDPPYDEGHCTIMCEGTVSEPRLPVMSYSGRYWIPGEIRIPSSGLIRVDGTFDTWPGIDGRPLGTAHSNAVNFLSNPFDNQDGPQSLTPMEFTAAYRNVNPDQGFDAAPLTAPANFSAVTSTSQAFTWPASLYATTLANFDSDLSDTDASLDVVYVIEIGSSFGEADHCTEEVQAGEISGSNFTVYPSCLPGAEPFFVRFWSQIAEGIWVREDYRYNTRDRLIACDIEDATLASTNFAAHACEVLAGSTQVCIESPTASGHMLRCDLAQSSTGSEAPFAAIASPALDEESPYEFMMFGTLRDGQRYCCLYDEGTQLIDTVRLWGGSQGDTLVLYDSSTPGRNLRTGNASSLAATVLGKQGHDWILGSSYTGTDYSEFLAGNHGGDVIYGFDGDDTLAGGAGSDHLFGGPGDDTLLAGAHFDQLEGGEGYDLLCTGDRGDLLIGSDPLFPGVGNELYVSSSGTGSFHPNTETVGNSLCGHTSHGTGWADSAGGPTCSYTLTAAPANCSQAVQGAYGIPD